MGYAEGDLIFEDRFFDENLEIVDLLAKQLVDLKCDVLIGVTARQPWHFEGLQAPFPLFLCSIQIRLDPALCRASITPVEMSQGLRTSATDVAAKRVELLRDTIPGLSSVALIWDTSPAIQYMNRAELEDTRRTANRLGLSFESWSNAAVQRLLKKQFQRPAGLAQRYLVTVSGMS